MTTTARPEPTETCAPERLLWINHTPHRVCCNRPDHWWTVPAADVTVPKASSAGSRR